MENSNMESVALLKSENRKLARQLKDADSKTGGVVSGKATATNSKVTQREVAALSVEHEMLTAQVSEMKRYL